MKPLLLALALGCAGPAHSEAPFSDSNRAALPLHALVLDGRLKEAVEAAREALSRSREESGEAHPLTAAHRRNLGLALWHYGDLPRAKAELALALPGLPATDRPAAQAELEALELDLKGLRRGPTRGTPEELAADAAALRAQGKLEQAWKRLEEAEALGRMRFGDAKHPFHAPVWEEMGLAQAAMGNVELKRKFLEMALEGSRSSGGLLHYSSLRHHEAMARILGLLGRKREALELWGKILKLREEIQSPSHPAAISIRKATGQF